MSTRTRCYLGHYHPSKSEANYCLWMLARKQNQEIKSFVYQFSIPLLLADGKPWKNWKIDFAVPAPGFKDPKSLVRVKKGHYNVLEVHESKGWNRSDDVFRLKLSICRRNYPDLKVYVNKKLVV